MSRSLFLQRSLGHPKKGNSAGKPRPFVKNRFRPQVDRIEERVVPTVLFTPVFG